MVRTILAPIVAFVTCALPAAGQPGTAPPAATRDLLPLTLLVQGAPLGNEQVVVERTAEGWTVSSTGRISPPVSFNLGLGTLTYDAEWRPRTLTMQGTARGTGFEVRVSLRGSSADVVTLEGTRTAKRTDTVSPETILLPNNFYGAYVALARRLVGMEPGGAMRIYVAPQAEVDATLEAVTPERLRTLTGSLDLRRHVLRMQNPSGALVVEVWTETDGRLARVSIPAVGLEVAREDVAARSTRRERFSREGDEDVAILANGFNLAATVSRPRNVPAAPPRGRPSVRLPAIVLVSGSGQADRDEVVAGIPIFGQLAAALADAGYLVVRYDKRGLGQSGGRQESVTLEDYADDVRAVVRHLEKRKDVDGRRIAVVGHSEGAWVAMLAASRDKRIARVVLAAGASIPGNDLVLEQQQALLDRANTPAAEAEGKIALQRRINSAVMFGTSWEGVPPAVRRQADTPWFASFLRFDPAKAMSRVRQPLLIVHGTLDRQVPVYHADKLAEYARARKKNAGVEVVTIDGVNHLFVPAMTGEVDEYATLSSRSIAPQWPRAIADWLGRAAAPGR